VFLCGPTGLFAVLRSAALFAATERAIADERGRRCAARPRSRRTRAANTAIDSVNLSSTHLQRFLSRGAAELDALEGFRARCSRLTDRPAARRR